ncbi:tRNA pseudouridine(13) synthase TruD [Spiribacter vilamensis]|uniref:tRNA pseudouridine synthase D n=1 Tax=Spiribacter vilamensis TaxID=531306 RepID=A0A4Q8CZV3_9GAMM|nr:tRNA pseudouridine(13) synthase TruD [Spiribacter vilamensis]RZU98470.1 tRNA pseudouridine13 synthase [Spiribacter vilamensis]
MSAIDSLPFAWGPPPGRATIAAIPEDFQVDERLGFTAEGAGPHLLVRIRKRGLTTMRAIQIIADHWQVDRRGIGYAGRKDRVAVTTQWLSVPWHVNAACPAGGMVLADETASLEILEIDRHRRKLPVGALSGNEFTLTLRDVEASPGAMARRVVTLARHGVPNYFGRQRFGRDDNNLVRARDWFAGTGRPRSRNDRSMLISAARSAMFNAVLAQRVRDGDWRWPRPGDLLTLDGRGSLFTAETEEALFNRRRAAGLRIHPTGPMPGAENRGQALSETLAEREAGVLAEWSPWIESLASQRVVADRRALRLSVHGLAALQLDPATWQLRFWLTRGAYATVVLRELVAEAEC